MYELFVDENKKSPPPPPLPIFIYQKGSLILINVTHPFYQKASLIFEIKVKNFFKHMSFVCERIFFYLANVWI